MTGFLLRRGAHIPPCALSHGPSIMQWRLKLLCQVILCTKVSTPWRPYDDYRCTQGVYFWSAFCGEQMGASIQVLSSFGFKFKSGFFIGVNTILLTGHSKDSLCPLTAGSQCNGRLRQLGIEFFQDGGCFFSAPCMGALGRVPFSFNVAAGASCTS